MPALRVALPIEVAPSRNETVPEGVPAELLLTVAVKVTDWPVVEGFAEEATTVVVVAVGWLTACDTAAEVLLMKLMSPWYAAVIECVPNAREEVEKLACPAEFSVPEPIVEVPSLKRTAPVGVVATAVFTVAVKVMDWPTPAGLADEASVVVVEA